MQRNSQGGKLVLNKRNFPVIGAFLLTLGMVTVANADPKLKTKALSHKGHHHDSGRHLAPGHSKDISTLVFPDTDARTFSVTLGKMRGVEHLYGHGDSVSVDTQVVPNPEPATMLLLGSGLAGLAGIIRKKRQASR